MYQKPENASLNQPCMSCGASAARDARLSRHVFVLTMLSCLVGVGMMVGGPALGSEVSLGESVVVQEPVVDAGAQRRANLRRALVEGSGLATPEPQARPMSRDERDLLNRELREVIRSAYDEYTVPAR
jgi:hypothetical protein